MPIKSFFVILVQYSTSLPSGGEGKLEEVASELVERILAKVVREEREKRQGEEEEAGGMHEYKVRGRGVCEWGGGGGGLMNIKMRKGESIECGIQVHDALYCV